MAGAGEEVVGGEAELHPGLVGDDAVEGQVGESAGFGVADDVLGSGASALEQLELGDVVVVLVGDERGVAFAFNGVEERQLRSGVGFFAADDEPCASRPDSTTKALPILGSDVCSATHIIPGQEGFSRAHDGPVRKIAASRTNPSTHVE